MDGEQHLIETRGAASQGATMRALSDRVVELAGQLNTVHAKLTEAMAEALEHDLWEQGAVRTPEQFLAWKVGVSPQRAKVLTRVARRRSDFPAVCRLFDEGQLSIEQVATCVAPRPGRTSRSPRSRGARVSFGTTDDGRRDARVTRATRRRAGRQRATRACVVRHHRRRSLDDPR